MPAARPDSMIVLRGAREHNLKGFDLEILRGRLTVVTGVSGSGKSSLAFDTLLREGQRRFLELMPSFARQFAGGFRRPEILGITGLGPAISVGRNVTLGNPRSTVGTLTEVWDLLRLLYARLGEAPPGVKLSRGLFAWSGAGACPACKGLGLEDRLDPDLLVADPSKSLREGALRVSTPNGYLMYSQVTLAVLDEVLRAHGGSVDVPWRELPDEARGVVLNGSDRLLVPFGKHPLENRLKWTGITARPRPFPWARRSGCASSRSPSASCAASSSSWTSRAPACTRTTSPASLESSAACATVGRPSSWSTTTRSSP